MQYAQNKQVTKYKVSVKVYTVCMISCLLYGCEPMAMTAELESNMEIRMIRWLCGVSLKERQR